jgi:hypothetical protein
MFAASRVRSPEVWRDAFQTTLQEIEHRCIQGTALWKRRGGFKPPFLGPTASGYLPNQRRAGRFAAP